MFAWPGGAGVLARAAVIFQSSRRAMPAADLDGKLIGFGRPPGAGLVLMYRGNVAQNRLNDRPLRLDRVLAREQQVVAGHRVAQQTFVGVHLFALRPLHYLEFSWIGHHHLARPLYLRTNGDYHVRTEPEAIIVRIPRAALAPRRPL